MNKDEALRLALEALEEIGLKWPNVLEAIDAIRLVIDTQNMASKSTYKEQLETKEYERGFVDGMQKQMQSSVDKAVNAMGKREWVGLTDEEQSFVYDQVKQIVDGKPFWVKFADAIEAKLKEKNT